MNLGVTLQLLQSKAISIPPLQTTATSQGRAVSIPEPPGAQTPVCSCTSPCLGLLAWHGHTSFSWRTPGALAARGLPHTAPAPHA